MSQQQGLGANSGVVISAISHEGLIVTVNGRPAHLAILGDDGSVIAVGHQVAREAEAVAIGAFQRMLEGRGHLRVLSRPISS